MLALSKTKVPGSLEEDASTRARALNAAVRLFSQLDFEACTMKHIAAQAGIQAPALYNYFESKEQILSEAMGIAMSTLYDAILGKLDAGDTSRWLELIVSSHATCMLRSKTIACASGLMMRRPMLEKYVAASEYERLKSVIIEYMRLLRDLIILRSNEEMTIDEGTVAAYAVGNMCDYMSQWYQRSGQLTIEDVAETLSRLIMRMIDSKCCK